MTFKTFIFTITNYPVPSVDNQNQGLQIQDTCILYVIISNQLGERKKKKKKRQFCCKHQNRQTYLKICPFNNFQKKNCYC